MQRKKTLVRTWLTHTFILIALCLGASSVVNAQITRDVGEIAVIQGDNNIIFTPRDSNGNPCGQVSVNMAELAKKFYQTHNDEFQFLIMFTNFNHLLAPDAACNEQANAFYQFVSNSIRGIGQDTFDDSATFGSSGSLAGVLNMGSLVNRPLDPTQRLPGSNDSVLSLFGQEVGHSWGAFVRFDSDLGPGVNASSNLLGRQNAHWSFFFHTASATSSAINPEASSLEGNFWQVNQPAPGQFQTATITDGFSPLDLYLIGLLPANQVGQFWFIRNPNNVNPPANSSTGPRAGTQTTGTQTFVTLQNIIDVEGRRDPDFADSPKIFRQAFILLTQQGVNVTQAQLDQIETYRVAWENYFAAKTQNRGAIVANLDNVVFVDRANTGREDGTLDHPFNTIVEGRNNSASGGTVVITAGRYPENLTFTRPLRLRAVRGTVTIGQ